MANSVLAKMAVQISANNAEFARALTRSQNSLSTFTSKVTSLAGTLGIAFGVQQVASFALEVSKLAGEAEGVRAAFERLPENTKVMKELKEATGGTVSELDLMKRAVQASNFGISLQALPKLLEFATLRAQQTGQSVDYLVDSIVTGIGRKSKLILDNLGISAIQLNEALGDTAIGAASIGDVAEAVGKIAEENLKNMAGFSDNASTKLQKLEASWTNLKVAIGEASNETGLLGSTIDALSGSMDVLASRDLTFFEKLASFGGFGLGLSNSAVKILVEQQNKINEEQKKQAQIVREVDRAFKEFNGDIDAYGESIQTHILRKGLLAEFEKRLVKAEDDRITTVGELRDVEKELLATRDAISVADQKALEANAAQVKAIRERIKAIDDQLNKEKELALTLSQTAQRAMAGTPVTDVTSLSGISSTVPIDGDPIMKMEALRNTSAEVTEEIKGHWIDLSGVMTGAISTLAEGLGGAIVGVENFGDTVLKAFTGFAKEFGSMLIASGIAALALETLISNPLTAIAAGAALVAIAGAASASLSNSHSKLTGDSGGRSGPGRTPSEIGVNVRGQISGYNLAIVGDKESYRRSRVG